LTFNVEIQPASCVIDTACRLILSDLATPENKKYPQVGEVGGSHNVEDNSTTHKGVGYHQLSTNNVIVRPKNLTFILPHHVLDPFSFFVLGPTHILMLLTTFFELVCNFTMDVRMEMGVGTSSTKGKYQSWVGTTFGG
jgi:hypothetical protein